MFPININNIFTLTFRLARALKAVQTTEYNEEALTGRPVKQVALEVTVNQKIR